MSEPDRSKGTLPGAVPGGADELEAVVVAALEAEASERQELLTRLEREDTERARRVRSRLEALGELGMALDGPTRATTVPSRFGIFERRDRVGGGGMGEVYLAHDPRDGSPVAIKLVRPENLLFETARVRFRREIQASSQLEHPGIVRVLEVGEESGVPWLAMEWVGGVSLEEVLERLRGRSPESLGPHDFERALRAAAATRAHPEPALEGAFPGATHVEVVVHIALRVAQALAHAHEEGVLHRDVKPSNVLVTPSGRVLLADFGLALPRGADRMTRTGQWLGSLPYAAPEQIEGSPRALDARADVYSLATTLYELITLRTPFLGGPESRVRRRIVTGDLEPPRRLNPSLPRELERSLLAAVDIDPRRRPAGARELAEDLERALSGRAVRARGAPPWLRARRWARRRPRLALAAAAASVAVLGSLGVALRETAFAARIMRLGDAELVRGLEEEAQTFWPASSGHLDDMDAWLNSAGQLLAREAEHRRAYEELTRQALPYDDEDRARDQAPAREGLATLARELDGLEAFVTKGDRAAPPPPPAPETVRARDAGLAQLLARPLEELLGVLRGRVTLLRLRMGENPTLWRTDVLQLDDFERQLERAAQTLGQRTTFRFSDSLDAWRHESLRRLLQDLARLAALVPRVRAQLASTRTLEQRFTRDGGSAWRRARAAIEASPRYGGLRLEPIFGLEPLGEAPGSGLWEFLLLASGTAPERDEGGRWRVTEATGVVLVLLPGGRFWMGQAPEEGPLASAARPQHEVELAPFFCSRYELTSAQAARLGGFPPERTPPADGRLPLVLDWERARALLRRHGLDLPTEAQWEYAARAGADWAELREHANVYDLARIGVLRGERTVQPSPVADFDDGFSDLAPVGSFLPNALGLHDVFGNVAEWCLDPYVVRGYSTLTPRSGDGLRATVVPAQVRVVRGGSYSGAPEACRPWFRENEVPSKMPYAIGVRPVRGLGDGSPGAVVPEALAPASDGPRPAR